MLHISIDDTRTLFQQLISARPASIFMTDTLARLQKLHRRYGTSFYLYCLYQHREYCLTQVPDSYRAEFLMNTWLHFGFHTYDVHLEYTAGNDALMGKHYVAAASEIRRITGRDPYNNLIRIHRFQGGKQGCAALREQGVQALLTADDDRLSYYLTATEEQELHRTGFFEDRGCGMKFYRTLPRIEDTPDILTIAKEKAGAGWKLISVFTHERLLSEVDVAQRLESLCAWGQELATE